MPVLQTDQQITYSVLWLDKLNNPVNMDKGPLAVWSVSDPKILSVTPSADGRTAIVRGLGLGDAKVIATRTEPSGTPVVVDDLVTVIPGNTMVGKLAALAPVPLG